ncbi:NUDIX hydrolase [Ramlibacter humi]|uniref:NUDIX domain-containing protein n=1 Tax=Ramlibacter humi TaxID=2530451 RepID=A0A4Z0BKG5_9BURK|nr:NUDIX domain-containing protein [Ramlibacter humi]TFY98923.1 NUDIX domain-containing protein [Ramlibacter humi]
MSGLLPREWVAGVQARLHRPPERPRVPLLWRGEPIGSVEPELVRDVLRRAPSWQGRWMLRAKAAELGNGALTPLMAELAATLRDLGLSHVWRDEQLAVCDARGAELGTVERAVVRPLGVATRAVHLVGLSPDGRHWVQQRAFSKANDPGLWDTLMGGMVPSRQSVEEALARETWEEAGLRMGQLRDVARGGQVVRRSPTPDGPHGYVVEAIDWYRCTVPEGVVPANQDGEVERFELLASAELQARLLASGFTLEASAIYAQALAA